MIFTEKIAWQAQSGEYAWDGSPIFSLPKFIDCRLENRCKRVVNEAGTEMLSCARIFTKFDVKAGDSLEIFGENRRVISSERMHDLRGKFDHCEVFI